MRQTESAGVALLTMTPIRSRDNVEYRGIFGAVGRTPRKIKPRAHPLLAFSLLPIGSLLLESGGVSRWYSVSLRGGSLLPDDEAISNAQGSESSQAIAEAASNFILAHITPPAPLNNQSGFEGGFGDEWRAFCVYFRTVLSLPGVQSLLYQLKSLCSLEAET